MVALDALVVSTALSTIRLQLHASLADLEWTVNAYVLSLAVLLMTGAALGDRLGRKRLFVAGMALFTAGSAACALAQSVAWLIAARAVQGAGAAVMMPLALALLSAAFPPERRAKALGIFGAVTGLGIVLGPLVGGAAVQGLSWPWIFWINVPIGLATLVFAKRRIRESFGPDTALDIPGLALVTAGALGIVWALVRGNSVGWSSSEIVTALFVGVSAFTAFVVWELRATAPMLPMRLFRTRPFSAGNAAIFILWGAALGSVFFMAQFLQIALHYDALGTGLRLMPWGAAIFVAAPMAGSLITRVGERPFVVGGLLLAAAGMGWLALIAKPNLPYWQMVAPLVISGLGMSMTIPATQSAVMSHVEPEHIGKASGTFTTLRQLGGAFGLASAVAVFASFGGYQSARAFSDGFGPALGVCAALALAGALAGIFLPRVRATSEAPAGSVGPAEAAAPRSLSTHARENPRANRRAPSCWDGALVGRLRQVTVQLDGSRSLPLKPKEEQTS
jgi:EmrB/QacA subfamily drug resistance transporter